MLPISYKNGVIILDCLTAVTVHYTGKLKSDGKQFDSSIGTEPISFQLGAGLVIKGWEDGLVGSCKGEKATLEIPSSLGYGDKGGSHSPTTKMSHHLHQKSLVSFSGAGDTIPPNADLIFEVELVDIDRVYHQEILTPKSCTKKQQSRDQDIVNFNYVGKLANGNRENTF